MNKTVKRCNNLLNTLVQLEELGYLDDGKDLWAELVQITRLDSSVREQMWDSSIFCNMAALASSKGWGQPVGRTTCMDIFADHVGSKKRVMSARYSVHVEAPKHYEQPLGWLKSFETKVSTRADEVLHSITVYAKNEQVTFQVRVARREGAIHIDQQSSDGNSNFHYYVLGK